MFPNVISALFQVFCENSNRGFKLIIFCRDGAEKVDVFRWSLDKSVFANGSRASEYEPVG